MTPIPETTSAFLWSTAIRRPTWHKYIITVSGTTPGGERGWEHIFECLETGAHRRWGFEDHKGKVAS